MNLEEKRALAKSIMDQSREMALADTPIVLLKMMKKADAEVIGDMIESASEEILDAMIFQMGMPLRMMVSDQMAKKLDNKKAN